MVVLSARMPREIMVRRVNNKSNVFVPVLNQLRPKPKPPGLRRQIVPFQSHLLSRFETFLCFFVPRQRVTSRNDEAQENLREFAYQVIWLCHD